MRPRCFGLGRRSLRAGTVRRLGRTRGRSLLSCVRMSMMPAELAWRTCSCPLFTRRRGETVWKIAEGVSSTLLWRQEAADRDFFDPSWPLRSPDSGSIPNFQTVSEGVFSEVVELGAHQAAHHPYHQLHGSILAQL